MADAPMDEDELATDPGDQVTGNAPPQGVAAPAAPPQQASPPAVGIGAMQARAQQRDAQIAALQPEIARRYGAIQQGYQGESENASALKQLLIDTRQRLSTAYAPPSTGERVSNILGAFATARPGGGFGNAAGAGALAGAQQQAQMRKDAISKEELMAKYGIEANQADQMAKQYSVQAAQAGMQPLMTQYNSAESAADRLAQQTAAEANKERNAPVINVNGMNTPNAALVDAKSKIATAEATARAKAQAAGFNPDAIETQAQQIADGNAPMLSGTALTRAGSPGLFINERANEISTLKYGTPADGTLFPAKQKAQSAYAAGDNARTINSLGVGLQHLGVVDDISGRLSSGGPQAFNALYQAIQKQFGTSTAPTDFDTAISILRAEIPKAIVGGRTALADRQEAEQVLSRVQRPDQLQSAIHTIERLFAGQLTGQRAWYERAVELGRPSGTFDQKFLGSYPGVLQILKPLEAGGVQPRDVSDVAAGGMAKIAVDAQGNRMMLTGGKWVPMPQPQQ